VEALADDNVTTAKDAVTALQWSKGALKGGAKKVSEAATKLGDGAAGWAQGCCRCRRGKEHRSRCCRAGQGAEGSRWAGGQGCGGGAVRGPGEAAGGAAHDAGLLHWRGWCSHAALRPCWGWGWVQIRGASWLCSQTLPCNRWPRWFAQIWPEVLPLIDIIGVWKWGTFVEIGSSMQSINRKRPGSHCRSSCLPAWHQIKSPSKNLGMVLQLLTTAPKVQSGQNAFALHTLRCSDQPGHGRCHAAARSVAALSARAIMTYIARIVLLWWVSHAGTVELACCALYAVQGRQCCEGPAAHGCSFHKLRLPCCIQPCGPRSSA
jgi:hypothetical protein